MTKESDMDKKAEIIEEVQKLDTIINELTAQLQQATTRKVELIGVHKYLTAEADAAAVTE